MPKYRKVIVAAMVIITMGHISFVCGFLFLCTPVRVISCLSSVYRELTELDLQTMGSQHHMGALRRRFAFLSQLFRPYYRI